MNTEALRQLARDPVFESGLMQAMRSAQTLLERKQAEQRRQAVVPSGKGVGRCQLSD